ncbi:15-hydroxyprostaglandin dehydrogenase [NAD(+)]-like [Pseudomyrmex gracilis]|uniref:15-hydroxyprostaglandin dehydrogenase [NAD(+)]-like n=1 Tax=Pseudomyrmex gracilis TaxID=219809 RepID=UPI000994A7E2|nr:15-hydroxyprostaglandin dehydrogenase [NAD(+)]-like [Pseudomyrmex gracilis]
MENVKNKTAMITGGATGLGYKYAEILLKYGARSVAIIDLPTSNGQNAATTLENEFGKGRVIFVAADVTDNLETAFKTVIDKFKTLDILINNAGIMNEHLIEKTININVTALIRSSFLALDHMGKHKSGNGGVIVNISSIFGLSTNGCLPVYCGSKYAVLGFSQALAELYDTTGVRILIMCPGITQTAIIENTEHRICNIANTTSAQSLYTLPTQTTDNTASAMLNLIQKGKNGAVWVSENRQPPYAVDFPHYSKRSLPV